MLAIALAAAGAQAQTAATGQTAEGAQKFMSALVKKESGWLWLVDAAGRTNYVQGKSVYKRTVVNALTANDESHHQDVVEKQLQSFHVTEIDMQGSDDKPDACMTRITKWRVRDQLLASESWQSTEEGFLVDSPVLHSKQTTYQVPPEMSAPHWIDWRNVKLARATNGAQMTASFKGKAYTVNLAFTGETELLDRVEYAMKFLKLSCDDTTSTGF